MLYKALSSFLLLLLSLSSYAQNTFSISGVVRDQKETLPGASIYVSGYKIATLSDADGKFILPNLKPGNYDILVQMIGYLPFSKNIIIADQSVKVDFVLKDAPITLSEVVIRVDPNRAKYINQFKEYFIGKSPNAKYCKIINPQVLRVDFDVTRSLLTVKTDEFLIVENKALGYRIKYMLDYFEYNSRTHIIYYAGKPFFEELKASAASKRKYVENRELAYYGSAQHFFKSLYRNTIQEEGFLITKMIKVPNPNRLPDSLINKNIAKLRTPPEKTGIRKNVLIKDTSQLAFWTKQQEMPKYIDRMNREKTLSDTLVHYFNKDLKFLNYTDALCVMYTKERETLAYDETGFAIFRPLDIPNYQISLAKLTAGAVRFYENGGIFDSRSLLFEGFWAYEKVADMVPMDYIPQKK
eukprot:GDKJ01041000.1.p2 GENE.GDKJ01041000.1~~GDKJ01041000.1.p2  ORF type:complete len:411 (-),score=11.39 GDKJ01041000.1:1295-2527(-)